ncbi:MAG: site-2 protease family protein, partial [Elusimicrobiota bacterium]|nr:site-2 protease family protein [Elusimicrobiota bacterium]
MNLVDIVVYVVILLFSVIVHEIAHALAALKRGDDTAQKLGRITLNPIPHLDLFGSIILPAIILITHIPILFAWAKPVPIHPEKFKNPKRDIALVAFAGPLANFTLAFVCSLINAVLIKLNLANSFIDVIHFLGIMIIINISLGVINLIPIPPLDGS